MIPEKETRITGNWKRAALAVLLALLTQGTILRAQTAEAKPDSSEPARKEWKPEDVVFTETAGQFRISPDGKWAVWVKSAADREKDSRVSNVLLSSLTEKSRRR